MFDRTAIQRAVCRSTVSRQTRTGRRSSVSALIGTALIGTALLGTLMIASGCQGPGAGEGLRLPGTPNLPGFHQVPTPKLTPGGKTPKVPGVTSVTPTEQHINPLPEAASAEIAQVGFVDRMRNRMAGNCGSCQGCTQGDSCGQCEMVLPNYSVVPLGRPVDPQEFLCNGGDIPPEARVLQNDQVGALEPQDAIVHYTTESGDINLQASNRVCLYSPRFGSVRQVSGAVAGEKAIGLQRTFLPVGPTGVGLTQPSLAVSDIDELAHRGRRQTCRRHARSQSRRSSGRNCSTANRHRCTADLGNA